MAIYRFAVQIIRRKRRDGRERSAVACAAYRAGEVLHSVRHGRKFSYVNKPGVVHHEILAPKGASAWVFDREKLWNAVERSERRRDAQLAREVQIALPVELSREAQLKLAREFIQDEFVERGMVADWALHDAEPEDPQPHLHVMLTMRDLGPEGFGRKNTSWNSRLLLRHWREAWEYYGNRALADEGHAARIDHRSYADRGLEFTAQRKRGSHLEERLREQDDWALDQWEEHKREARENGDVILRDPQQALDAVSANQATFTRKELLDFLQQKTADKEQFDDAVEAVFAQPDLIRIGAEPLRGERFTTRQVLRREVLVIEAGRELARRRKHNVRPDYVYHAAQKRQLGKDQSTALEHITFASGDLALVEGWAGTGKSYMLGAAREAWEAEGLIVIGAALAGKAAEGLQHSAGIESRTLARWERAWRRGRATLTDKHVLVIDEAGMVGTAQMARILERACNARAKVVLVGDTRQLQAIEAGAPMRVLREELGAAILSEIRRQHEPWQRHASRQFAQERTKVALRAYADHGCIVNHSTHAQARQAVVDAWQRDRIERPTVTEQKDGQQVARAATSIILSYRRADVRTLNETVRGIRERAGELGKSRPFIVTDRDGQEHRRDFAPQDRIYFLENDPNLGGVSVMNGTLGTIEGISGTNLTVRLDEGSVLTFDARTYTSIDHGYAATVHKSQGVTVDRAYVVASAPMDEAATYVAMTRHRAAVELHWGEDEFQPTWAQTPAILAELGSHVRTHGDEVGALAAAMGTWRTELPAGNERPPVLIGVSRDDVHDLNVQARSHAQEVGRLGSDIWVRTTAGAKAFAIGDRVQVTDAIDELSLRVGTLGTIAGAHAQVLRIEMDDGRLVALDTSVHRSLDHGYAVSLEQSRGIETQRSIVVLTERLDEQDLEVLQARNLGTVEVHAIEAPAATHEWLFERLSRAADKEHALEVAPRLDAQRRFVETPDHRPVYAALPSAQQEQYLETLQAVGAQSTLSVHQAMLSLPEVKDATASVQKAENAFAERRLHREAFQGEASLVRKVGEYLTERQRTELVAAEQALERARTELDQLMRSPELNRRASELAAEHNQSGARAHTAHQHLSEQRERLEREQRLQVRIAALREAYPTMRVRFATPADFDRELTFHRTRDFGNQAPRDPGVILKDADGTHVVFDGARFRSDLSALEPGQKVAVDADFHVTVSPDLEAGVEMDFD